jgi:hypothetical protein
MRKCAFVWAGLVGTLILLPGCGMWHIASQEVPAGSDDHITAGQPVDDQGSKTIVSVSPCCGPQTGPESR